MDGLWTVQIDRFICIGLGLWTDSPNGWEPCSFPIFSSSFTASYREESDEMFHSEHSKDVRAGFNADMARRGGEYASEKSLLLVRYSTLAYIRVLREKQFEGLPAFFRSYPKFSVPYFSQWMAMASLASKARYEYSNLL